MAAGACGRATRSWPEAAIAISRCSFASRARARPRRSDEIRRLLERGLASRPRFRAARRPPGGPARRRRSGRSPPRPRLIGSSGIPPPRCRRRVAVLHRHLSLCPRPRDADRACRSRPGASPRSECSRRAWPAVERLASADTVVFDKTGTLTLSAPRSGIRAHGRRPRLGNGARDRRGARGRVAASDWPRAPLGARPSKPGEGGAGGSAAAMEARADHPGQGVTGTVRGVAMVDRVSRLRPGLRGRAGGARCAARLLARARPARGRPHGPPGTGGALHVRGGASARGE